MKTNSLVFLALAVMGLSLSGCGFGNYYDMNHLAHGHRYEHGDWHNPRTQRKPVVRQRSYRNPVTYDSGHH